jgi:hypothetical protein
LLFHRGCRCDSRNNDFKRLTFAAFLFSFLCETRKEGGLSGAYPSTAFTPSPAPANWNLAPIIPEALRPFWGDLTSEFTGLRGFSRRSGGMMG